MRGISTLECGPGSFDQPNGCPPRYASLRGVVGEIGNVTSDPHSRSTLLCVIGAVDGARSRNTQFGKLVLYQLSYYGIYGDRGEIRTPDHLIKSQVLFQLSYTVIFGGEYRIRTYGHRSAVCLANRCNRPTLPTLHKLVTLYGWT